jgi:hypothetical protein
VKLARFSLPASSKQLLLLDNRPSIEGHLQFGTLFASENFPALLCQRAMQQSKAIIGSGN